ncbi:MazG family protein [Saccharopolyspora sp. TS4A08]|uniref:MazG family protein n=1 Tax=Saccharopolyspora ipomoeae TaxID=3042027 RepID=A0ABT6PV56_9PSEU|nr:MazG family protein [Saccharopolyspora sp. TS4A08]MDI2031888.1 MazG family protein [Saccharopolyspora sp. TS4A08]
MSELRVAEGTAIVLVDDRLDEALPAAALPLLREAAEVFADAGLSAAAKAALGVPEAPEDLVARAAGTPVVLITGEIGPDAETLRAAGALVVGAPAPDGVELLDAVTVMDRLRSPGGCPWDAEQDHDSLRQYLVEEAYELLDAIAEKDRAALREELGDVLLQVLFHARVAAEDPDDPFGIDAVAAGLVSKLVSRHPHVFADDTTVLDTETQHARWEELKQQEKQRESIVDGVALGQPAVALAAKITQRAARAGIPLEAMPSGSDTGSALFALTARGKLDGTDPEDALRSVSLEFAARIRAAERRARETGRAELTATDWNELLSGSDA